MLEFKRNIQNTCNKNEVVEAAPGACCCCSCCCCVSVSAGSGSATSAPTTGQ